VNGRPEEDRATTTPTAVFGQGRRRGTTMTWLSSPRSSLSRRKVVSAPRDGRYNALRRPVSAEVSGANAAVASGNKVTLREKGSRCVGCGPGPIGVDELVQVSRSTLVEDRCSRSVIEPAGGPDGVGGQLEPAPAPRRRGGRRRRRKRPLAGRPGSRPVRGTAGTANEGRLRSRSAVAASILLLRPPLPPNAPVIRRCGVATEGIGK
jgi:hypothetical protein